LRESHKFPSHKSLKRARYLFPLFLAASIVSARGEMRPPPPKPKLVVFLAIDQGRGDYLERFRPVLEGGLRTLLDRGVVFTDAHQMHATTVTAAGHASLATGLFPAHSGMVGNQWFERAEGREVNCVEDREAAILAPAGARRGSSTGRSPKRLLGTALGDWMQERWPGSKVFAIGGKDRSAILMGGKKPFAAYWYDQRNGQWVSSRYYMAEYPDWVREFQKRSPANEYFETTWEVLPVDASLLDAMEITSSFAATGAEDSGAPMALGGSAVFPDSSFDFRLFGSPYLESYMLDFAELLVRNEKLGQDDVPDLLALGFSSVDTIGHAYGPDSREVLDAVMRLDRELGRFLRFLDEQIGLDNVAFALSADHGVAPLPEIRNARGLSGSRPTLAESQCLQKSGAAFEKAFGKAEWFVDPFYFDYDVLARHGVKLEAAEELLARELSRCPTVAHVWTRTEIESSTGENGGENPLAALYRNGFHSERSPDLILQFDEYHVERSRGTTHGSTYAYDTRVPAILLWPGAAPKQVGTPIATVDLPVTLACLLGVSTPHPVDGVDRSPLVIAR
jgi:predicted AlkP superfamily pyrophosphatase or phosphodiesterase